MPNKIVREMTKNIRSRLLLSCLIALLLSSCNSTYPVTDLVFTNADGSTSPKIKVEIVSTSGARSLGLMYRKKLPDAQGMVFVFAKEEMLKFWMKNTYVELDIIYLNAEKRIVSIVKNARPLSTASLASEAPAIYVLEVAGGLSDKWHLTKGSKATFDVSAEIVTE